MGIPEREAVKLIDHVDEVQPGSIGAADAKQRQVHWCSLTSTAMLEVAKQKPCMPGRRPLQSSKRV